MISQLTGVAKECTEDLLILEVGAIGFDIYVGQKTSKKITLNQTYELYVNLIFKNDAFTLYGFLEKVELNLFKILIKVAGIGPKTALSLISAIGLADIYKAAYEKNSTPLTAISGIGKKTAERLVVALNHRLEELTTLMQQTPDKKPIVDDHTQILAENIRSALTNMGFSNKQINKIWDSTFSKNSSLADNLTRFLKKINIG